MRYLPLAFVLLLAGCPADDTASDSAADSGSSGRPVADASPRPETDAGTDSVEERDADSTPDGGPSRPDVGTDTRPPDAGDPSGCAATTLDEAIACQVDANAGFVDAFCDCFTDTAYDGDRAACIADQPSADAFEPDACVRAALRVDEAASVRNSVCYAAAVDELAACVGVCPPTESEFDACFTALNAAFDLCDASLPSAVTDALDACAEPEVEPPSDVAGATDGLVDQRDDWATVFCGCYGSEFGGESACVSSVRSDWDPGLSSCEQSAFAASPADALPFLQCLREAFLIAETACLECPGRADFEYELCSDPRIDIQFCFNEASPALQDALMACGG